MNIRTYRPGEVIFRQGDPGACMYDIQFGKVGIFLNYGEADEKKLAELMSSEIIGEMGLLDHAPRSATAVALAEDTTVDVITEKDFYDYFRRNPSKVLLLLQQMCSRLRRTTKDYLAVCDTVYETVETEKAGKEKSEDLLEKIRRFCQGYKESKSTTRN